MGYSKIFIFVLSLMILACFPRHHQTDFKDIPETAQNIAQEEKPVVASDAPAIKKEEPVTEVPSLQESSPSVVLDTPAIKKEEPVVETPVLPVIEAPSRQEEKPVIVTPDALVIKKEEPAAETPVLPVVEAPSRQEEKPVIVTPDAPVIKKEEPVVETPMLLVIEAPSRQEEKPVIMTPDAPVIKKEEPVVEVPSLQEKTTVVKKDSSQHGLSPSSKGISSIQQRQEILETLPFVRMEVEKSTANAKGGDFLTDENPKKTQKLYKTPAFLKKSNTSLENFLLIEPSQKEKKLANYPIQIARPFIKGEIHHYPQAYLDELPLITQADVKCRWDDGSVKHAILSFIAPEIKENSKITFRNQKTGNNDDFESKERILIHYNFEACMKIRTQDHHKKISAREMIKSGHFSYWQRGSVCTSIIIADHSEKRVYDVGSDNHRSIRPIFHATFWPGLKKFRVRFIGEICNSIALQDQFYELELLVNHRNPKSVYKNDIVQHHAMSRWTKEFWGGENLPSININHNLQYLIATKLIPNYDYQKNIPDSVIEQYYNSWLSQDKNLFSEGNWTKYMPGTGGRWDIGPYPDWVVFWLYTGDSRLLEMSAGNSNLAASWPVHCREGKTGLFFDLEKQKSALGKVVSINARPSIFMPNLAFSYTANEDRINPVKILKEHSWVPDLPHQPDPDSVLYMLTGDFWYLEQMYFWASWTATATNGDTEVHYGRGPKSRGGISSEIRGQAWAFRNRVRVACLAPDAAPEKKYFTQLVEDAIAIWEGQRNITKTSYEKTPAWQWGNTLGKGIWGSLDVPPLHFWNRGNSGLVASDLLDTNVAAEGISPWEQNFMMFALGHAKELGFKTDALSQWLGEFILKAVVELGVEKVSAYRMPTIKKEGKFFANFSELKEAYKFDYNFKESLENSLKDPVHGYSYILIPSVAMAKDTGAEGGKDAWKAIKEQVINSSVLNYYPKWLILPRTEE